MIADKLQKLLNEDNMSGGNRLPDIVYRGSRYKNEKPDFTDGTYVSTDKKSAEQYGKVKTYKITKQPKLLDLGNWNSVGVKKIISKLMDMEIGSMDLNDYDIKAAEAFIQADEELISYAKKNGYDGVRLGYDAFLIGKITDYAEEING
jgi:hypothetical protein